MLTNGPLLNLVVLRARNLPRTRQFYEVLEFFFEIHKHGSGAEHLAGRCSKGSALLEIYPLGEHQTPTTSVRIGFSMDAIDPYIDRLLAAGGKIIELPHDSQWVRRAVFQDPEGHKVELVSP